MEYVIRAINAERQIDIPLCVTNTYDRAESIRQHFTDCAEKAPHNNVELVANLQVKLRMTIDLQHSSWRNFVFVIVPMTPYTGEMPQDMADYFTEQKTKQRGKQ